MSKGSGEQSERSAAEPAGRCSMGRTSGVPRASTKDGRLSRVGVEFAMASRECGAWATACDQREGRECHPD